MKIAILVLILAAIGGFFYVKKDDLVGLKGIINTAKGYIPEVEEPEPSAPSPEPEVSLVKNDSPASQLPPSASPSSELSPRSPKPEVVAKPVFPIVRALTDSQGRDLHATILAKSKGTVVLRRTTDQKEFIVALTKLSGDDQKFLSTLVDTNPVEFEEFVKSAKVAGRQARWHTDIKNAQREAEGLGLPIFLLFTGTSWCTPCKIMERNVINRTQFKEYANRSLVLMKVDVPESKRLNRWDQALGDKYGIVSYPTVVLIGSDGTELSNKAGGGDDPEDFVFQIRRRLAKFGY